MDNVLKVDFSAFAALARLVQKEGQHGLTAGIRQLVEDLDMTRRCSADGESIQEVFSVTRGDEVLELEHMELGVGSHSYGINRFKLVDSQLFDFGGLLAKC